MTVGRSYAISVLRSATTSALASVVALLLLISSDSVLPVDAQVGQERCEAIVGALTLAANLTGIPRHTCTQQPACREQGDEFVADCTQVCEYCQSNQHPNAPDVDVDVIGLCGNPGTTVVFDSTAGAITRTRTTFRYTSGLDLILPFTEVAVQQEDCVDTASPTDNPDPAGITCNTCRVFLDDQACTSCTYTNCPDQSKVPQFDCRNLIEGAIYNFCESSLSSIPSDSIFAYFARNVQSEQPQSPFETCFVDGIPQSSNGDDGIVATNAPVIIPPEPSTDAPSATPVNSGITLTPTASVVSSSTLPSLVGTADPSAPASSTVPTAVPVDVETTSTPTASVVSSSTLPSLVGTADPSAPASSTVPTVVPVDVETTSTPTEFKDSFRLSLSPTMPSTFPSATPSVIMGETTTIRSTIKFSPGLLITDPATRDTWQTLTAGHIATFGAVAVNGSQFNIKSMTVTLHEQTFDLIEGPPVRRRHLQITVPTSSTWSNHIFETAITFTRYNPENTEPFPAADMVFAAFDDASDLEAYEVVMQQVGNDEFDDGVTIELTDIENFLFPTESPTKEPTLQPSLAPSVTPSSTLSGMPSVISSVTSSPAPTGMPSTILSATPSFASSSVPTPSNATDAPSLAVLDTSGAANTPTGESSGVAVAVRSNIDLLATGCVASWLLWLGS